MITEVKQGLKYDEMMDILNKNNVELTKVYLHFEGHNYGEKLGVNALNGSDYLEIVNAIDKNELIDDSGELLSIKYSELKKDEISNLKLHRVSARVNPEYISSTESIEGNHYRSDCDTYGAYYYHMRLFYVKDMNVYFVIEERWIAC